MKIFIAAAVLAQEEQKQRALLQALCFAHTVPDSKGVVDISLQGRGNPLLSTATLDDVAEKLKKSGVEVVRDIIIDDGYLDPSGLARKRIGPGYAPPASFGLDLHTISIVVAPSSERNPPVVTITPPNPQVRIANSALTTATILSNVSVKQLDDHSYSIAGSISAASAPVSRRFALADPAIYGGETFRHLLLQHGMTVKGKVKRGRLDEGVGVGRIPGPSISQLLRDMNYHSLNVVADNLFLVLAAEKYGVPGTRARGSKAVEELVRELAGDGALITVADGSGLSAENRLSVRTMASFLAAAYKKGWGEELINSLPRAGLEGTAASIPFQDERFRTKTGILEDVFAVAGYGYSRDGRLISFAFMVNAPGAGLIGTKNAAEVLRYLAQQPVPQALQLNR